MRKTLLHYFLIAAISTGSAATYTTVKPATGQSAPGGLQFLPPLRFQKGGAVPFNSIVRVQ